MVIPAPIPSHPYEWAVSPHEALTFPRVLAAEPASPGCSRSVEAGRAGPTLHSLSPLDSSFLNFHNPGGPHVHSSRSLTHTRSSMNFFFPKNLLCKKNPPLYKKERHQSWVSLTLATQKLEFFFDTDANLLGVPWASHGNLPGRFHHL